MKTDDRQRCTPETPMPKGAAGRWTHQNAVERGDAGCDCCARYECPDCGHVWKAELPE